jgi:hypothetical protein
MAGTRWVRLDVDYFQNPKILAAGRNGRDLHLASICWCGQQETDGHVPATSIPTIAHMAGLNARAASAAVAKVVAAGLWQQTEHDYYVKDYLEMNRSRAAIERERELWKQRARKKRGGR